MMAYPTAFDMPGLWWVAQEKDSNGDSRRRNSREVAEDFAFAVKNEWRDALVFEGASLSKEPCTTLSHSTDIARGEKEGRRGGGGDLAAVTLGANIG